MRKFDEWTNRTLVYGCRQIADQAHKNFDYSELQQVIQVSIMDYTLFEDHKRFFTRYEIRDEEGYRYSDKLQFYVMDLTAIDLATEEEKKQGLTEWGEAFSADDWEGVREIQNSAVKEAAKTMELIMRNPTERELVRARMDALIDMRTMERSAERRGREQGEKIGREQGEKLGREQGEKSGKIKILASLVTDGILTTADAANRANMTVTEFKKQTGL